MADDTNTVPAPEENAAESSEAQTAAPAPEAPPEKGRKTPDAKRRKIKKILKYVGIAFGVLFALLILAIIFRDRIIEVATRKIGSSLTGAPVDVRRVDTSLFGGTVKITDFSMGNPPGYTTERKAVTLHELYVKINIGSLFTNKIEVVEVRLNDLHVNCEINVTGCNFNDIYANIQKNTQSGKKKKKTKKDEGPQVVVRLLKVENINLALNAIPLPSMDYEKRDIGEEGGSSWKDIQQDLMQKVQAPTEQLVNMGTGALDKLKGLF